VNSNRPGSEYLIPTVVTLSANGARVGRAAYPRGTDRKFKFTTKTLNVYEGSVRFPFRLTVPRNYRGKSVTVTAVVDFQACSEEVCYAPRKETITIEAAVR
jgi:DsbC/DsbD-like thiol-disulfide interchange protein